MFNITPRTSLSPRGIRTVAMETTSDVIYRDSSPSTTTAISVPITPFGLDFTASGKLLTSCPQRPTTSAATRGSLKDRREERSLTMVQEHLFSIQLTSQNVLYHSYQLIFRNETT